MTIDQTIRLDRSALVRELEDAGGVVRGSSVRCPFHEDKAASGSIHQDDAGVWRFKCFAGGCGFSGDVYDIRERRTGEKPGRAAGGGFPARPVRTSAKVVNSSPGGVQGHSANQNKVVYPDLAAVQQSVGSLPVEGSYVYTDPDTGRTDMIVLRIRKPEGKAFWQFRPVEGGFIMEAPPKPWPIYNRTRVKATDVVLVVEGESAFTRCRMSG